MNNSGSLQPYVPEKVEVVLTKDDKLKEFYNSLYYLIEDYPELADMKKLFVEDINRFKVEYPRRLIQCVAKTLDIPKSGVDILGGKPYINKTGLLYKVHNDKRKIKKLGTYPVFFPFKMEIVQTPESEYYKHFLGRSEEGDAVFVGYVEFRNGEFYWAWGTANAKYLKREYQKMSTMQPYVVELAGTRALNRAIREATGMALISIEEVNERGGEIIGAMMKDEVTPEKQKLLDTIESQFKQLRWNSAKKLEFCNRFGGDLLLLPVDTLSKIVVELSYNMQQAKSAVKKTVKKSGVKNEAKVGSKKTSKKTVKKT